MYKEEVVTDANAVFREQCFVSDFNSPAAKVLSQRQGLLFSMNDDLHVDDICQQTRDLRARKGNTSAVRRTIPVTSCVLDHYSVVLPCSKWRHGLGEPRASIDATMNKYCAPAGKRRSLTSAEVLALKGCYRVSVPLLSPALMELAVHPENINHVGRDMAFLASMIRLANRSNYTVITPGVKSRGTRFSDWGKNVMAALSFGGKLVFGDVKEQAGKFRNLAMRMPRQTTETNRDLDVRAMSCGILCFTEVHKFGPTGFIEKDDYILLRNAVLQFCKIPVDTPTKRTFLLISRKPGSTRVLANLAHARKRLRQFAASLGLQFTTATFGNMKFCEQVRVASASYVMVGIHGADLINMFWQHEDATILELYGRDGLERVPATDQDHAVDNVGITTYLQQLAASGRRGIAAKLLNVSGCSGDWMYDSKCVLQLDVPRVIEVLGRWLRVR